ncbi:acetyltransferase [Prauserella marina]|uniref:Acetyltransferase (GNAT) family protein n=1 Tax=Prauserella marina TaxID=530584 RepID=A0A222VLQ4_9PSEU|nr:GNAT family N-acetyltransferase [Prauserella marina]ASR34651.1 acetyltransferase [Prauserella marina]PWV85703.1 acetyltransferase (GNAT) family protein [Prauserella marina]SDC47885.1 Acetyltransferase (GNAT) family protein [Prauserella marina]
MSDIVVRAPRPEEIAALGELTVAAYSGDGYLDYADADSYAAALRDAAKRAERAELLGAFDGEGTPLGTVTVAPHGSHYAELAQESEIEFRMLAVAPSARGRGVGELLVRAVFDRARRLGAHRVVLCTQPDMTPAHRLYERLGFRRLPERDWSPVPTIMLMAFVADV